MCAAKMLVPCGRLSFSDILSSGVGFESWGLGFRVWGLGFTVQGVLFRVLGFRVSGLWCGCLGFGG